MIPFFIKNITFKKKGITLKKNRYHFLKQVSPFKRQVSLFKKQVSCTLQKTGITFQNVRQRTLYAFCLRKGRNRRWSHNSKKSITTQKQVSHFKMISVAHLTFYVPKKGKIEHFKNMGGLRNDQA